jgi:hypothetical protein
LKKGKLQPQAIELEAVLGAMMIDKRDDVIDILQMPLQRIAQTYF